MGKLHAYGLVVKCQRNSGIRRSDRLRYAWHDCLLAERPRADAASPGPQPAASTRSGQCRERHATRDTDVAGDSASAATALS
jgi:hypothetical protein